MSVNPAAVLQQIENTNRRLVIELLGERELRRVGHRIKRQSLRTYLFSYGSLVRTGEELEELFGRLLTTAATPHRRLS